MLEYVSVCTYVHIIVGLYFTVLGLIIFLIYNNPPTQSAIFINGKALLPIRSRFRNNNKDCGAIIFVVVEDDNEDCTVQVVSSGTASGVHLECAQFDSRPGYRFLRGF